MAVFVQPFEVETEGHNHVLNLTAAVEKIASASRIHDGIVVIFVVGSTAAITTIEFEPGLVNHDLAAAFEKIAPQDGRYEHEQTWNDDNGHAHICAALLGPSLVIPLVSGRMPLGTWQQIVLIDFDTRSRTRTIMVQITGEAEK